MQANARAGLHPSDFIVALEGQTMQSPVLFIGVDVGATELCIASSDASPRTLANTAEAISLWLEEIPPGAFIAMESTGRYHGLLAQLAHARGLAVYVLNARDVFFYARSLGIRGKTDRVDAQLIARYLAQHHDRLHPWAPGTVVQQQIHELSLRRAFLAHQQASIRQSITGISLPNKEFKALADAYKALLHAIDVQVQALIQSDPDLAERCTRLRTIIGIGPQTSAVLGALLSRLHFTSADSLVAFCGLDPRPNDSGAKHGRRRLTKKGPPLLRRLVYLAGMSASHSKALMPLYEALRARGFATTEACLILGRKLLRIAFSLWNSGKCFDVSRLMTEKTTEEGCQKA